MTRLVNYEFFNKVVGGMYVIYGSVTYQPNHPFGNANIKVKEQWRMR